MPESHWNANVDATSVSFVPVYIQGTLYLLENVKETSESRWGYRNNYRLGKWESRLVIVLIYVANSFIQPLLEKEPNRTSRLLYKVKKIYWIVFCPYCYLFITVQTLFFSYQFSPLSLCNKISAQYRILQHVLSRITVIWKHGEKKLQCLLSCFFK